MTAAVLAQNPLFAVFTPEQLERIVPHVARREYPQGVELARLGDPSDALFLLEAGAVGVYARAPAHPVPTMVAVIEPGEVFCEAGVLTGQRRTESYVALEPCIAARLGADVVVSLCEQSPAFGLALARLMSDRLQRASLERDVPWVSLVGRRLDMKLWSLAPDTLLRRGRILPLQLSGRTLTVGMVDPADAVARDALARALSGLRLRVVAIGADEWLRVVEAGAPAQRRTNAPEAQIAYLDEDESRASWAPPASASAAAGPQIVAHVDEMIATGLSLNASDIHLEHDRRGTLVRYRVDGALQSPGGFLPAEVGRPMVSRLKLLAKMDITETRKPQDGRISLRTGGRLVDLRVSSMPAKLGEKMVLRVLDAEASITNLENLFPVERVRQLFTQLITRPQGLVLVSGPTGSGKTTTLYSALHARRRPEINVVTVEDPIEYHLDGVTQVQVSHDIGVTFAAVLRTLLRQDPNVIMVGETRDLETARMAIEASMTGHLVLTSVHTNGALEAVVRLADIGIEQYAIANGLNGVLHQRLVRRMCRACAAPFDYPPQTLEMLHRAGAFLPGERHALERGRGCAQCGGTGFKGRVALYELLVVSEAVRDAITHSTDLAAVRAAARQSGSFLDMARYAGVLVAMGITAPGEVLHLLQRG